MRPHPPARASSRAGRPRPVYPSAAGSEGRGPRPLGTSVDFQPAFRRGGTLTDPSGPSSVDSRLVQGRLRKTGGSDRTLSSRRSSDRRAPLSSGGGGVTREMAGTEPSRTVGGRRGRRGVVRMKTRSPYSDHGLQGLWKFMFGQWELPSLFVQWELRIVGPPVVWKPLRQPTLRS